LDAMYVEGLVHITELGGEYFRFDEARQELRGERTGIRYAIGTRVQVQVSRVDLDGRKIDFRLIREGEDLPVRNKERSGGFDDAGKGRSGGVRAEFKAAPPARKSKSETRAAKPSGGGKGAKPAAGPNRKAAQKKPRTRR
jgi:ribonuclease R